MALKINLKELAENYKQKRRIDKKTLSEITTSISTGLEIKPGDCILDIGCGSGRILLPLAAKNPKSKFIGVDISKEMLDSLNKDISKGQVDNVTALEHDANYKLPFVDKQFDSVILYHSYHIIQNKDYIAKEIRRVLKPKGILLIATTSHTQLATTLNYKYIPEMLQKEFERTPDITDVSKVFRQIGFRVKIMREILIKKRFNNLDDWINFLREKPISALTFFKDRKLEALLAKMKRDLISDFGDFAVEYGFDYHTQMFFIKNDNHRKCNQ